MRAVFPAVIRVAAILALLTSFGRGAELPEGKTLPVWPNGPEEANGLSGAESTVFCVGNISTATMTVYIPPREKATGAAVVITPGGGYGGVCLKSEGKDIARILIDRGIAAVVLKYRLPNGHFEIPGADARRAIRTTRHHAGEWGINPNKVGVWGFSAGGHLASTVATVFDKGNPDAEDLIERQGCRPDFAILFYPVISMETEVTHVGSRTNLLGPSSSPKLQARFCNDQRIGKETPPTFLLHCTDDHVVPVENSLRFYRNLVANKIPAQLLIFEKGGHGPGAFTQNPSWEGALDAWLKRHGCM